MLGSGLLPLFQLHLSLSLFIPLHPVQPRRTAPDAFLPLGVCSSRSECLLLSARVYSAHPSSLSSTTFNYERVLISWAGRNLFILCTFKIFFFCTLLIAHMPHIILMSPHFPSLFFSVWNSSRTGTRYSVLFTPRSLRSSGFFRLRSPQRLLEPGRSTHLPRAVKGNLDHIEVNGKDGTYTPHLIRATILSGKYY